MGSMNHHHHPNSQLMVDTSRLLPLIYIYMGLKAFHYSSSSLQASWDFYSIEQNQFEKEQRVVYYHHTTTPCTVTYRRRLQSHPHPTQQTTCRTGVLILLLFNDTHIYLC